MTEIVYAESGDHLEYIKDLLRTLAEWHREQYQDDPELMDFYFNAHKIESELENLPGEYAFPGGRLLLAFCNGQPAGCVALRGINLKDCEMKRMFVYPQFSGRHIDRSLTEKIIDEARAIGYSKMLLDTSIRQQDTQILYKSLGFREMAPYYEPPAVIRKWLVFMEMDLNRE